MMKELWEELQETADEYNELEYLESLYEEENNKDD